MHEELPLHFGREILVRPMPPLAREIPLRPAGTSPWQGRSFDTNLSPGESSLFFEINLSTGGNSPPFFKLFLTQNYLEGHAKHTDVLSLLIATPQPNSIRHGERRTARNERAGVEPSPEPMQVARSGPGERYSATPLRLGRPFDSALCSLRSQGSRSG